MKSNHGKRLQLLIFRNLVKCVSVQYVVKYEETLFILRVTFSGEFTALNKHPTCSRVVLIILLNRLQQCR